MDIATQQAIALTILFLQPLALLLFLVCFCVWFVQGKYDNGFTRFCHAMMIPSGGFALVLIFISLRYF